jgi:RHS repeat-associated protein
VTISVYDGNTNLIKTLGPVDHGGTGNSGTAVVTVAFGGGTLTQTGDLSTTDYDGFDRPTLSTDPLTNTAKPEYDPGARAVSSLRRGPALKAGDSNVDLSSSTTLFDEAGRAYETQQNLFIPSGGDPVSGRSVDLGGSIIKTQHYFDRLGRTYKTVQDNGGLIKSTFDGASRTLSTTDPLNNKVESEYDANGNATMTTRTDLCPDVGTALPEVFISLAFYDVLNRQTATSSQGADANTPASNPNSPGTDSVVTTTGYDSRGNVTITTDPRGNTSNAVYDGASRKIQTYVDLRTGGVGSGSITSTINTLMSYDGNSRQTQITDSNSNTTTYLYDSLNRQTRMTFPDGSTRIPTYNPASDQTYYTDENGTVFSYAYDRLSRRTSVSVDSIGSGSGVLSQVGVVQTFEYDGLSRVTKSTDTSALFDGDPGEEDLVTDFLHLGQRVVEERDAESTPLRQYVWGNYIDELLQQREFNPNNPDKHEDYYPLPDLHFRSIALVDEDGCVCEAYDTDAYGVTQVFDDLAGVCRKQFPICPYIYTGRYYDAETAKIDGQRRTGIYYYRARHFWPDMGRFGARDAKGYPQGMGLYQYGNGNPLIGLDPQGTTTFWEALGNEFTEGASHWMRDSSQGVYDVWHGHTTEAYNALIDQNAQPIAAEIITHYNVTGHDLDAAKSEVAGVAGTIAMLSGKQNFARGIYELDTTTATYTPGRDMWSRAGDVSMGVSNFANTAAMASSLTGTGIYVYRANQMAQLRNWSIFTQISRDSSALTLRIIKSKMIQNGFVSWEASQVMNGFEIGAKIKTSLNPLAKATRAFSDPDFMEGAWATFDSRIYIMQPILRKANWALPHLNEATELYEFRVPWLSRIIVGKTAPQPFEFTQIGGQTGGASQVYVLRPKP